MERMEQVSTPEGKFGTVTEKLDRVESLVGKIGFNSSERAFSILHSLDEIHTRLQVMENSSSRKTVEAQLEGVYGKLRSETGPFLKDLGGAYALSQAREQVQPPKEHWWWYLDEYLADRRRTSLKRTLTTLGIAAIVLVTLAVVYQLFLAPDPAVTARFQHEQASQDRLIEGDYEQALLEVEKGLEYAPQDVPLLVLKGVILENMGQVEAANQTYAQAEQAAGQRDAFLVSRGQAYVAANQPEKAQADVQEAIEVNPRSAIAYLLSGQIHEIMSQYAEAMIAYDKAYEAATANDQSELAALARTRTAMLLQVINAQVTPPDWAVTPTAAP